jgi:hypothetical protein
MLADEAHVMCAFNPDRLDKSIGEGLLLGWDQSFDALATDSERTTREIVNLFGLSG